MKTSGFRSSRDTGRPGLEPRLTGPPHSHLFMHWQKTLYIIFVGELLAFAVCTCCGFSDRNTCLFGLSMQYISIAMTPPRGRLGGCLETARCRCATTSCKLGHCSIQLAAPDIRRPAVTCTVVSSRSCWNIRRRLFVFFWYATHGHLYIDSTVHAVVGIRMSRCCVCLCRQTRAAQCIMYKDALATSLELPEQNEGR